MHANFPFHDFERKPTLFRRDPDFARQSEAEGNTAVSQNKRGWDRSTHVLNVSKGRVRDSFCVGHFFSLHVGKEFDALALTCKHPHGIGVKCYSGGGGGGGHKQDKVWV